MIDISRYITGITGASGSIYAVRLIEALAGMGHEIHLVITDNGRRVMEYELGAGQEPGPGRKGSLTEKILYSAPYGKASGRTAISFGSGGSLTVYDINDLFAPIASGSFRTDGMAVIPCSMATLGAISAGTSGSLLGRAADVCLKEKRRLVLVPRETPLSAIHLRNMLSLSEAGAVILPAMPAFYGKPSHITDIVDFIVGRVLDSLGIENNLYEKWGEEE